MKIQIEINDKIELLDVKEAQRIWQELGELFFNTAVSIPSVWQPSGTMIDTGKLTIAGTLGTTKYQSNAGDADTPIKNLDNSRE